MPEEQQTEILDYLMTGLDILVLLGKMLLNIIKFIDDKFAEWGGGRGSIGHFALWGSLITIITAIIIYTLWNPIISTNLGRFNIQASGFIILTYGTELQPLSTSSSEQEPNTVAEYLEIINTDYNIDYEVNSENVYYPKILTDPSFDDPILHDSDGDGLTDNWEMKYWEMHGRNQGISEQDKFVWMYPSHDLDGDGLINIDEFNLGTNPNEKDTDGDGISDHREIFPQGSDTASNPLNVDTDGDLLTDDMELEWGTDASRFDTDGDTMNDGWEVWASNVRDYKPNTCGSVTEPYGLHPTVSYCDSSKGDDDPDGDGLNNTMESKFFSDPQNTDTDGDAISDYDEVSPLFDNTSIPTHAIPFKDLHGFVPATDPKIQDSDFDGFSDSQEFNDNTNPIDSTFNKNSDIDEDGMLDTYEYQYDLDVFNDDSQSDPDTDGLNNLEEFTANTNPHSSDTDQDGLPDKYEVDNQLDPLNDDSSLDPDSDGLSNLQEYNANTDPHNSDTDGDNLSDGQEINSVGTDPLSSDTDGDGMPDGWEHSYSPTLNPLVYDANEDPDNDQLSNLQEYQQGTDPTVDDLIPTITITNPSNGAKVRGGITIKASASDNDGIASVIFTLPNGIIVDDTTYPYSVSFDTRDVSDGIYSISAVARDISGNVAITSVQIYIDNTAPSVSITSPGNNKIYITDQTIKVSASDNDFVTKVKFYVDGVYIGQDTSSPYTKLFDISEYSEGSHTIKVVAYDDVGNSRSKSISVKIDKSGPSVSSNLSDGDVIEGVITISATVTDVSPIDRVVFKIDSTTLCTDTSTSWSCDLNTWGFSNGYHTIKIIAYDIWGYSTTLSITVKIDNSSPPFEPPW